MESKCTIHSSGKYWKTLKDELHREDDFPAIEYDDGYKAWFINNKRHRELGPAIIDPNGTEKWYLDGINYTPKTMPIKLFMAYCNWEYKKISSSKAL